MKSEKNPQELLMDLCRRDPRYPFEAYEFIFSALGYVQEKMIRERKKSPKDAAALPEQERHVTGQQLAEGCRDFALQEFGMMAGTVFRNWNIHKTDDIGELVYNLIELKLLTKTDTDRKEDFHNVYDMSTAFSTGFQFNLN
ncbi:MAG TPA: hypothetical protein PKD72_15135 [Gemmatales bacterium]|nr:hypothetical protein [Gemmatales bacterium]